MKSSTYSSSDTPTKTGSDFNKGVEWNRSIFSATRSSLSHPGSDHSAVVTPGAEPTLLKRLPDAQLALRFEAILDALAHISKHAVIREYRDKATASMPTVFAVVRLASERSFEVGLALPASEDELLIPCANEWAETAIVSKFIIHDNEALTGKHLRFLRLASRTVS